MDSNYTDFTLQISARYGNRDKKKEKANGLQKRPKKGPKKKSGLGGTLPPSPLSGPVQPFTEKNMIYLSLTVTSRPLQTTTDFYTTVQRP